MKNKRTKKQPKNEHIQLQQENQTSNNSYENTDLQIAPNQSQIYQQETDDSFQTQKIKKNKQGISCLKVFCIVVILGFMAFMIFFAFNQDKILKLYEKTVKQNKLAENARNVLKTQQNKKQIQQNYNIETQNIKSQIEPQKATNLNINLDINIDLQKIQSSDTSDNTKPSSQTTQKPDNKKPQIQNKSNEIIANRQIQNLKIQTNQTVVENTSKQNQDKKQQQKQKKPQPAIQQHIPSSISTKTSSSSTQSSTNIQNNKSNEVVQENKTSIQTPIIRQKYRVRQKFRQKTPAPSLAGRDRYQFTISIQNIVNSSPMKYMFANAANQFGIKRSPYERAIRLMEVVHNVNVQGQYVFDHFNFYKSAQQKYKAFEEILSEQKLYYDQKYEINKYWHNQIGMCVYVPSYNTAENTRLYLRALDSVFQQDYKNYHVVLVDDFSTDKTGDYAQSYMQVNNIPKDKYTIIKNDKRKLNSQNSYIVGNQYCNLGQIMIMLDGDDALIGRQVFSLLNAVYQKQKIALTYGTFLLVTGNSVSGGYSTMDIPQYALQQGTYRKLGVFYASHLKTMYVDVFRQIKITDFQYPNGTFLDYATDVIFMTPGIDLVGTRLKFIRQLIYEYNYNTGLNQPAQQQRRVELLIYTKPAYKRMEKMDFADNPKTIYYP